MPPRRNVRNVRKDTRHSRRNQELGIEWRQILADIRYGLLPKSVVLICYDVEFPELSRIMADQGMQILFVPFLTDTQNAYSRVKVCAHARAIENECFVVIAGSVGNLPRVHNMDIQYAQSGVFTPCDFAFPTDGKRAEATPNTEMILVSDVDLDLLNELHTYGSVRNLKDRRNDLYEVKMKK